MGGLAIIGGTGVYEPGILENPQELEVETAYGAAVCTKGMFRGTEVLFMARHGKKHSAPPHRINYRANIMALHMLGATKIIATAAVGSLKKEICPGDFILPHQFIDFTRARPATFFDGEDGRVVHVDMTEPYCPELRRLLASACRDLGFRYHEGGVYVCTEGPRFETPAEIAMFSLLGATIVGMTGVPEVVLARELGMCYATFACATNYAAGLAGKALTHEEVIQVMRESSERLRLVMQAVLKAVIGDRCPHCQPEPENEASERND